MVSDEVIKLVQLFYFRQGFFAETSTVKRIAAAVFAGLLFQVAGFISQRCQIIYGMMISIIILAILVGRMLREDPNNQIHQVVYNFASKPDQYPEMIADINRLGNFCEYLGHNKDPIRHRDFCLAVIELLKKIPRPAGNEVF